MFQRRLTKDQLKAYGLPAFANGGIVQKFETGGDVTIPSGYQMSQAPFTQTVGAPTAMETIIDPQNYTSLVEKGMGMQVGGLKMEIQKLEAILANPNMYSEAQVADAKARLPELKKQLTEAETKLDEGFKKEDMVTTKDDSTEETETDATGTVTDKAPVDELTAEEDELSRLKTLALERSDLYKQMLGDPKEMMKQQGLLQLAQFGLNLASARGGNLAEKIAKSAADPLQAFAQLASDASKDARAIDLAAIKSAEEQLALETELAGKQDDLVKINLYAETKNEMPGDTAGAAAATGYLPAGELKDIDVYRDDSNRISSKQINKGGASNEVFKDTEGQPWKIKPGALEKKKYLTFPDDFEKVEGVEIITPKG